MFWKKKPIRYVVELSPAERKLAVTALMRFCNKLLAFNKPIEDVNDHLQCIHITGFSRTDHVMVESVAKQSTVPR